MAYRLSPVTRASLRDAPPVCVDCVFWQSRGGRPPRRSAGPSGWRTSGAPGARSTRPRATAWSASSSTGPRPLSARRRAAGRAAVARRRARHLRVPRRPLLAVGPAEPLPRGHRRGTGPRRSRRSRRSATATRRARRATSVCWSTGRCSRRTSWRTSGSSRCAGRATSAWRASSSAASSRSRRADRAGVAQGEGGVHPGAGAAACRLKNGLIRPRSCDSLLAHREADRRQEGRPRATPSPAARVIWPLRPHLNIGFTDVPAEKATCGPAGIDPGWVRGYTSRSGPTIWTRSCWRS